MSNDYRKLREYQTNPRHRIPESLNNDGTKHYTCIRCERVFFNKNGPEGVKQHLVQVHVANGELQLQWIIVEESKSKKRKAKDRGFTASKKQNLDKHEDESGDGIQPSPET